MSARVIGLTGQTGAGKTTVCRVLSEEGFHIINCDALTRDVQSPGSPCVAALAAAFGQDILLEDGALNRRLLAGRAFSDASSLALLNKTVYPYIITELERRIKTLSQGHTNGIVLDAPTLLESGADALCSEVIAVLAPEGLRLARVMARDHLTEQQVLARMAAQQDDAFYTRRAQHILYNDGPPAALEEKARALAHTLLAGGKPDAGKKE